jgi:O-antigen ligase
MLAGIAASLKLGLANTLLGIAFIAWLVALARRQSSFRSALLYIPLGGYAAASLLSVAFSSDRMHSAAQLAELITMALVPMAVSMMDRHRWDRLVILLAAGATLSSGIGLWQYAHGASTLQLRISSVFSHYMTFSGWTLVVVLLLAGDMAFNRPRRMWWSVPVFLLCCTALMLSFTRNAWIGLAAGLLVAVALRRPRYLLAFPLVVLALALLAPTPVVDRAISILDPQQHSNYDRICMMRSGIDMVADHPLTGVGLGMVKRRYSEYRVADAPRERVAHLHNNLAQIAAERGLLGLASYFAVLIIFFVEAWRVFARRDGPMKPAVGACVVAVVGITVAGFFEYNWGDTEVWILTLVCLGMPFARDSGVRR